jgi:uncharacterized repeat protein (TIGR01451 family)
MHKHDSVKSLCPTLQSNEVSTMRAPARQLFKNSFCRTAAEFLCLVVTILLLSPVTNAQVGYIRTVAGGGPTTIPRLNGAVSNVASTGEIGQIAWDSTHQVFYFTSITFHRIYQVDPGSGTATSLAGNGFNGFGGDGGDASLASFSAPVGIVVDPTNSNYLYVADTGNNRVRRINIATKSVDTVFGSGVCNNGELTTTDVAATLANLCAPGQMAIDGNGVLYVFDLSKSAVWRLAAGQAHMIAGNGSALTGVPSAGGSATAMSLGNFAYLAVDSTGKSLYLNEPFGLRQLDLASGLLSAPLDLDDSSVSLRDGLPVAINPVSGHVIYAIYPTPPPSTGGCNPMVDPTCGGGSSAPITESIFDYDPATATKTQITGQGSAVAPYLSPTNSVNLGTPANGLGDIVAIAPSGGTASAYVASRSGWIHSLDSLGANPNFLTILGNGSRSYCGDGGPATSACLDNPTSVSAAPDGTLFIVDSGNGVIRYIDSSGIIHSLVSPRTLGIVPTAIVAPPKGIILYVFSNAPFPAGTLLFTSVSSHQVFALDPATDTTTLYSGTGAPACPPGVNGGGFLCDNNEDAGLGLAVYGQPLSIAIDSQGNPFVTDPDTELVLCLQCTDSIVRVVGGGASPESGQPALFTQLNFPDAVVAEPDNGLLIAEKAGQMVRRVNPDPYYGFMFPFNLDSQIVSDVMNTSSVGANFAPVGVARIPGLVLASDAGSGQVVSSVRPGSACPAGSGPLSSKVFAGGGTLLADNILATQVYFGSRVVEAGVFSSSDGLGQIASFNTNNQSLVYIVDRANNRIRVVQAEGNHPPVANAGPDQHFLTPDPGVLVTLDGTASTDQDCDFLSYTWSGPDLDPSIQGPVVQVYFGFGVHVVTLTVDDGYGGVSTATVTITVIGTGPDVALSATPSATSVATGQNLTYNMTVTNNGPGDVTNVQVVLPITPAAIFVSGTAAGGPCTGPATADYGTVTCMIGGLASGVSSNVSLTISPTQVGTLGYTLKVYEDQVDSNPANNSVSISTQVTQATGGGSGGSGGGGSSGGGSGGNGGGSGGSGGTATCNCTLTGNYVDPAKGVDVSGDPLTSPNNKFTVHSTIDNINHFNTISITRNSDGALLVPESSYPITAHWGFSPDGNRIAIHAVDSSQEDEIWVFDLTTAPARQVVHYRLPVVSDRLQFSPSSQYFLLMALVSQGRTEIDIYRVAGVTTQDRVFQTSFSFQSVPGVNEDQYGAASWGFSPDQPESSFVYAYGNGQSTVSLNIANLTSPHLVPVLNGWNITGVAGFWQFNPCGNLLGVVWQPNPSQVEVDLFNTQNGSRVGKSGVTFPTDFVALASTTTAEQATVGFNPPMDIATNPDCAFNTPTGTNIEVIAKDPTTGTTPVTVSFANVTQAGQTSISTGSSGAASPAGFDLGAPPTYYEITTTAVFAGSATVCINYSGISFSGSPKLNHYVNGAWVDITTSVDTVNHIVCGTTTSFSPFALFQQDQPPAITSSSSTTFQAGSFGSFSATTTGFPAPSLSTSGSLPAGIVFFDNGDGTASIGGNTPSGGAYPLTITATNGAGTATQPFTLYVDQAPVITSSSSATFIAGTPGSFSVIATGYPIPAFVESGTLPSGVTFDGASGTFSGTPSPGAGGMYAVTITASNSAGTVGQAFSLVVDQAPAITSASSTTFALGSADSFTVQTTGYPTPFLSETGTLPQGITFTDNGNGSGTLSGTSLVAGTYSITIGASNGVGNGASQNFTLTVPGPVANLNPSSVDFGNVALFDFAFRKILLKNTGTSKLVISKMFLTPGTGADRDDFYFLSLCGTSLAPGKSCIIAVAYFGDDSGSKLATLTIVDNASGGTQTVSLTGNTVP